MLHPLREYARAKAPEVGLRIGGVVIVGIPIAALVGLLKLLKAVLRGIRDLPIEVRLLLLALVAFAAFHPATRRALSSLFSSLSSALTDSGVIVGQLVGEVSLRFVDAEAELKLKQLALVDAIGSR